VLYRVAEDAEGVVDGRGPWIDAGRLKVSRTTAREIHIPEIANPALDAYVRQIEVGIPHGVVYYTFDASGRVRPGVRFGFNQVFLTNQRDEVLAGEYLRSHLPAWVLPPYVGGLAPWLRLFLQRLAEVDPQRVPDPPPPWTPWFTADELRLREQHDQVLKEANEVIAEYKAKLDVLGEKSRAAKESADAGIGRLLTSDGDGLNGDWWQRDQSRGTTGALSEQSFPPRASREAENPARLGPTSRCDAGRAIQRRHYRTTPVSW